MPTTTLLAPMTPDAAISAFSYLRAVQADGVEAAREFASGAPRMPELLVDVVERIVVPVTALPGPDAGEPSEDTFALEALGRVFITSLRIWAQTGPDTAEGIARAVIDFAAQFLTEGHEDVADTLRQLEAVGVGQALDAHPAPTGSHPAGGQECGRPLLDLRRLHSRCGSPCRARRNRGGLGTVRRRPARPARRRAGLCRYRYVRRDGRRILGGRTAGEGTRAESPHAALTGATPHDEPIASRRPRWAKTRSRIEREHRELQHSLGVNYFGGRTWRGRHHHVTHGPP